MNALQYIFVHTHVQYWPGDVNAFQLADALQYIFMHAHVQYWPSNVDACQLMNALQSIFVHAHVQYQPGNVDTFQLMTGPNDKRPEAPHLLSLQYRSCWQWSISSCTSSGDVIQRATSRLSPNCVSSPIMTSSFKTLSCTT